MRILLTSNASHLPPRGGSTRSNLAWLDRLAAGGHLCRVVAGALATDTPEKLAQVRRELEEQEIAFGGLREITQRGSIEVHSVADPSMRVAALRQQIRDFQPDWVLVSSEDIGQALLAAAQDLAPGRVVYLAHTPQFYPFGPASWNPDRRGTDLVSHAAAVIAIARHTAEYIRTNVSARVEVIHPPIYGAGPFAEYGRFAGGRITMINPCAVKGISIFLALAARFGDVPFAALPGWGTTTDDRRALQALPNVTLLANCKNIDDVLKDTRTLLVPSLWLEGFGLIVVEAMLRGIPVIASDSGGLMESKLGTRFMIPVRPIERYEPAFDEQGLPRAVLPDQDLKPWVSALGELLADRALYERESAAARRAALDFVTVLRPSQFEDFLRSLVPVEPVARPGEPVDRLSPEKRELFLRRLRARPPG